jgi:hypothetical protein
MQLRERRRERISRDTAQGTGHQFHRFLLGAVRTRKRHIGLQDHTFQHHSLSVKLLENRSPNLFTDFATTLQGVLTLHQHFRLYHGNQSAFLTQRGVSGQCLRVSLDTASARNPFAYRNHSAPFGETGAHLQILSQAAAQSVQALRDFLAQMKRQVFRADVDFYPGNDSRFLDHLNEGRAIVLPLADGLVVTGWSR